MIKRILLDTTFLLPFFGIDLGEINDITYKMYVKFEKLYFAEISIYEVKFKLVSLYRKSKIPYELLGDFWRNYRVLLDDKKIAFMKYNERVDKIVNALERDSRIELSIIDQIIVATAVEIGTLLTLDSEILENSELLSREYGIKVLSIRDMKKYIVGKK